MEYPHIGKHCANETCKRLDFLPVQCDACDQIFCSNHMSYVQHKCPSAYKKNIQVPVCPLCNKPVPIQRGASPDIAVGNHIDNDCQSDEAQQRKKVFTNKCTMKGCKTKEIVPVICYDCHKNFCFKHRHTVDHQCAGMKSRTVEAALLRQKQNVISRNTTTLAANYQGNMNDDEALARALQRSLEDEQHSQRRQNGRNDYKCLLS